MVECCPVPGLGLSTVHRSLVVIPSAGSTFQRIVTSPSSGASRRSTRFRKPQSVDIISIKHSSRSSRFFRFTFIGDRPPVAGWRDPYRIPFPRISQSCVSCPYRHNSIALSCSGPSIAGHRDIYLLLRPLSDPTTILPPNIERFFSWLILIPGMKGAGHIDPHLNHPLTIN